VLSPEKSTPLDHAAEFVMLASDPPNLSIQDIEDAHLAYQQNADFVYLVNPGGYIGLSAAYEIGVAKGCGKPVFALEQPADPMLATRRIRVISPAGLIEFLQRETLEGI